MEQRMGEIPDFKPEGKKEKNKRVTMEEKIREFIKFQKEGLFMKKFSETDFGYDINECEAIKKRFEKMSEMVSEADHDPNVLFETDNPHLEQIVSNSPSIEQILAEKITAKKTRNLSPEADLKKMRNLVIMNTDLTEEDIDWFLKFKKNFNLLLYYFDLMEDAEHRHVLISEITKNEGWLESFKKYYKIGHKKAEKSDSDSSDKAQNTVEYIIFPDDSISRLQNINFFARLEGWKSNLGNEINETEELCEPIDTKEEFEEAFEKLKNKGDLDKEAITYDFLEKPKEFKKAA